VENIHIDPDLRDIHSGLSINAGWVHLLLCTSFILLLSCYSIPAHIMRLLLLLYDIDGGAGTSSGPAARAKWEIEYHIFCFAPCIYLFLFLPSESCGGGGGILIVTAFLELSHNAAAVARYNMKHVVSSAAFAQHTGMQTGIIVVFGEKKNKNDNNNKIKCTILI
jgi:hypothetical protein